MRLRQRLSCVVIPRTSDVSNYLIVVDLLAAVHTYERLIGCRNDEEGILICINLGQLLLITAQRGFRHSRIFEDIPYDE